MILILTKLSGLASPTIPLRNERSIRGQRSPGEGEIVAGRRAEDPREMFGAKAHKTRTGRPEKLNLVP